MDAAWCYFYESKKMIEAFTSQRYHYRYQWPGYGPLQMMTPLTCQMSLKMKILSSFICYRYVWCQVKKKLKSEKRKNTTWHLVYSEYINFTKMFYNDIELSGVGLWTDTGAGHHLECVIIITVIITIIMSIIKLINVPCELWAISCLHLPTICNPALPEPWTS